MRIAHKDLDIGYEIEPLRYAITQEKMNIYSRYGRCCTNRAADEVIP